MKVVKVGVIDSFRGEYAFLSNFHPCSFKWRNFDFASSEHAFQAAKMFHFNDGYLFDGNSYLAKIQAATTPAEAKKIGRTAHIEVDSWNEQKVQYMREIVHAKFSGVPGLAGRLVNTGAMMLVEGNTWGDTFWGRSGGKGFNTLGAILMEERGYWLYGGKK